MYSMNFAKKKRIFLKLKEKNEFSLDTSSEEDDEDEGGDYDECRAKRPFIEEKSNAMNSIGQFAKACPIEFSPYFGQA